MLLCHKKKMITADDIQQPAHPSSDGHNKTSTSRSKKSAIANEDVPTTTTASKKRKVGDTSTVDDEQDTFFVFFSTDFYSPWPLNPSAFCIARNEQEAIKLFNAEFSKRKLKTYEESPFTLQKRPCNAPFVAFMSGGEIPARFDPRSED